MVTYEDLTRLLSAPTPPPPQSFRKEINLYRVFVEFVVLLTKIWPKNIDFHRYS